MKFSVFIVFSVCLVEYLSAFNLESRIPIVKKGSVGSFFGFSVAEHQIINEVSGDVKESWLLVGAPLGQNLQPNTSRSGALLKCPITTRYDDCIQVTTDGKRSVKGSYPDNVSDKAVDSKELSPPLADEIKDGQWMGVTVRSQKPGGKVIVCAHRYIRTQPDQQWGQGLCYTLSQYLDFDEAWEPCKGLPLDKAHEQYGYCQAGTSAMLLDNDSAVIGTPGVYTWRGTVFVVNVSDDFLSRDHSFYHGPHTEDESPVEKYGYLGMSVTGAKFFGNELSYASGAPRASGTGTVVLFTKFGRNKNMKKNMIIHGEQFASSFGYEVASADLNGDGLPDLIVGAPFYFSREEGGAVYIYYNNDNTLKPRYSQKLTGLPESRFGFAIANLGDINLDGFQDLAVGAPYEDAGAVYIYLGSAQGLIKEPSQVIHGSQVPSKPVTFGYSLSGGVDMDLNTYPDLMVGAYDADSVFLLRARPIIDITTEVQPESALRNIDPTVRGCEGDPRSPYTCFKFQTCCRVKRTSATVLQVVYRLEAETFHVGRKFSRVWIGRDNSTRPAYSNGTLVLRSQSGLLSDCQEHIVYLKENTKDIQSPIKMKLSYTLLQREPTQPRPGDPLPHLYPILNQKEAAKIIEATFHKDCGSDDVCQSDLQTHVELELPRREEDNQWVLMLGSADILNVSVSVENHGESAYEAQFFIFHPASISYNRIESKSKQVFCQSHNKTVVACQIGNPLKNDSLAKFQIKFDVKHIGDTETGIKFIAFSNSTSEDENPVEPQQLVADVVKKAELSMRGSARPEQVFYGGIVRGESAMLFKDDIGSRVIHTYVAYNAGPSRVRNLAITVTWPIQVANKKEQGKWLLYLDENPTVEAIGQGNCYVPSEYINPLFLGSRPGVINGHGPAETNNEVMNETMAELRSSSSGWNMNRLRRELRVRSERVVDSEGRAHSVVNFNCINGTAKCIKFKCDVYNLNPGHEALVRISARLWNSTLVEDYPRVSYVTISSRAELSLTDQPLIQNPADDIADVTTFAYPDLLEGAESESVPLWIMVVAAVAGILLLLLIVLVCWKIGFFKRNRPDPTLTGNLQKANQDAL